MVAKTPLKEKRLAMALNPNLVRETVNKVDRCMARLQELRHTVTGGTNGVSVGPRSTRGYLRPKQEFPRVGAQKSPAGKFQGITNCAGEWRRMSLPAMLLNETVTEILQASKFAKDIAATAAASQSNSKKNTVDDVPKTPDAITRHLKKPRCGEITELRARRLREKRSIRSESGSPPQPLPRARSRITFKPASGDKAIGIRPVLVAHRVSPKNRPWARKTVLFPNPLFSSSSPSSSQHPNKFYKTRSPIIARTTTQKRTPHKFLIKTPPTSLKSQIKSKKLAAPAPMVFSPPVEKKLSSPSKIRRCSFSPSKLANRLVSPLKGRISLHARSINNGLMMSGLKQRPNFSTPVRIISSIKRVSIER